MLKRVAGAGFRQTFGFRRSDVFRPWEGGLSSEARIPRPEAGVQELRPGQVRTGARFSGKMAGLRGLINEVSSIWQWESFCSTSTSSFTFARIQPAVRRLNGGSFASASRRSRLCLRSLDCSCSPEAPGCCRRSIPAPLPKRSAFQRRATSLHLSGSCP